MRDHGTYGTHSCKRQRTDALSCTFGFHLAAILGSFEGPWRRSDLLLASLSIFSLLSLVAPGFQLLIHIILRIYSKAHVETGPCDRSVASKASAVLAPLAARRSESKLLATAKSYSEPCCKKASLKYSPSTKMSPEMSRLLSPDVYILIRSY